MDIDEIRRINIKALWKDQRSALIEKCGMQPAQFYNLRDGAPDSKTGKPRGMRKETAWKIEDAAGVPRGYLDKLHLDSEENAEEAPDLIKEEKIPVVGEVQGGDDGYLEELEYPVGHGEGFVLYPSKDKNAFALRVRGESMHPRYRSGEFVIVEPSIEPQPGEDVVVSCKNGRKMLKVFAWKQDDEFQFLSINNGFAPITLKLNEIDTIFLVSGRASRRAFHKD